MHGCCDCRVICSISISVCLLFTLWCLWGLTGEVHWLRVRRRRIMANLCRIKIIYAILHHHITYSTLNTLTDSLAVVSCKPIQQPVSAFVWRSIRIEFERNYNNRYYNNKNRGGKKRSTRWLWRIPISMTFFSVSHVRLCERIKCRKNIFFIQVLHLAFIHIRTWLQRRFVGIEMPTNAKYTNADVSGQINEIEANLRYKLAKIPHQIGNSIEFGYKFSVLFNVNAVYWCRELFSSISLCDFVHLCHMIFTVMSKHFKQIRRSFVIWFWLARFVSSFSPLIAWISPLLSRSLLFSFSLFLCICLFLSFSFCLIFSFSLSNSLPPPLSPSLLLILSSHISADILILVYVYYEQFSYAKNNNCHVTTG